MDEKKKRTICGAKRKQADGKICQLSPTKGRSRCRFHGGGGGGSLCGVASPSFKHGRYSRVLNKDVRKKFEEAGKDQQLLSHEPELKLLDVQLDGLVGELGQGSGPEYFAHLQKSWKEYQAADSTGDEASKATSLSTMDSLIQRGGSDKDLWKEIREVIDSRRKLLEAENRRIRESQHTLTAEQIAAVIEYAVDVVDQSVKLYVDRAVARKILNKVTGDMDIVLSDPSRASEKYRRLFCE